jgi:hypothetical protein
MAANCCLSCCRVIRHLPTRTLCLLLVLLQGGIIDYYLVINKSMYWMAWVAADVAVAVVFIVAFIWSYRQLRHARHFKTNDDTEIASLPLGYITWLVYATVLSVRSSGHYIQTILISVRRKIVFRTEYVQNYHRTRRNNLHVIFVGAS